MKRIKAIFMLLCFLGIGISAQTYRQANDISYAGKSEAYLYELDGHGHGGMVELGFHILETHLDKMLGKEVNP